MVREQREKIQNRRKGDIRFEGEGGVEVQHWLMGTRLNSGGLQAGEVRGENHSAISRKSKDAAGGSSRSERKLPRVLDLEESSEHP